MDKSVELLKLLRGKNGADGANGYGGLRIVKAATTDPSPVTFVFEGTSIALDMAVFEVPVSVYPICAGDTFLASPMIGSGTNRWGIVTKVNNAAAIGTMVSGTSCTVPGIGRTYTSADLLIPPWVADSGACRKLKAGDTVLLVPTKSGSKIKYAITQYF